MNHLPNLIVIAYSLRPWFVMKLLTPKNTGLTSEYSQKFRLVKGQLGTEMFVHHKPPPFFRHSETFLHG